MDRSMKIILRMIGIDLFLLTIVAYLAFFYKTLTTTYKRGFFCNDESISYPYKESFIGFWRLMIISLGIPMLGMLFGEFLYAKIMKKQSVFVICGINIPIWISMAYNKIGVFAFGAAVNVLITESGKLTIGRLRPHFLEICKPNISCSDVSNFEIQYKYHIDYECTNNNTIDYWDAARKSFPSGHASCMIYGMLYFALYLQLRVTWKGSKLLRHSLQIICLWFSWYVAMSRISDYMHHWSDVCAGMLLGAIVALIHVFCISDLFEERQRVVNDNSQNTMIAENIKTIESENRSNGLFNNETNNDYVYRC
ncbi:putative phosphatidate phosphatase [Aphidius gifuensis]|uniref:putative phosphatidate phosphatase n=1 Tax=Aphidius gifuensis TaxID=684658 RepID=UPI001CDD7D50|nr:putative phosphatidate phosphatase [Aphidius gifuensis]